VTGTAATGDTVAANQTHRTQISRIFAALDLLVRPDLVKVQRADLVGEHLTATAIKTKKILDSAQGGVLQLEHVGSTSVPGLPAKPIIDIDLTVADPEHERDHVPALEAIGFRLVIREPWWYGHRALVADEPRCNLHVFGFDSAELVRHRIFRDWLRGNAGERDRYAATKRHAASEANAGGEHVMPYNARKQQVIREIYHRAFVAAGLLEE
jgi:GrpB-like predicted nucleotidyltransferase (UPF0157 family)